MACPIFYVPRERMLNKRLGCSKFSTPRERIRAVAGRPYARYYDSAGKIIPVSQENEVPPGTKSVDWYVIDKKTGNKIIIQKFP